MKNYLTLFPAILIATGCLAQGSTADLIAAIKAKDNAKVKDALAAGADANSTFEHNLYWGANMSMFAKFTPLMLCSDNGFFEGALELVRSGAKVNETAKGKSGIVENCILMNAEDVTALHIAAGQGHEALLKLLIQAKCNQGAIMTLNTAVACPAWAKMKSKTVTAKKWAEMNGKGNISELIQNAKKSDWAKEGVPNN
jgi:hypothetical protein